MKHDGWVNFAQFSADGQRVVTASRDKTARVWDAATGKAISEPMKHDDEVNSAQFSADGQRVVTASKDKTARVWDAATGKAISEPMKHDDEVNSAQFSADGQRVVTASKDKTARVWDIPTIARNDSADDTNLLADLAEATGGLALQAFGQTELLAALTPDQVKATRDKIAVKFSGPPSKLTPLQRFLKWSVSDPRRRTISPFSKITVPEWIENRVTDGTLNGLRAAVQLDPENARLAAHFGRRLADFALETETNPDEARRAKADADFQTRRALKLASDNDEVKKLRAKVAERCSCQSNFVKCFISSPATMPKIGSVYRLRLRGRGWYTTKRTSDKRRTIVRLLLRKRPVVQQHAVAYLFRGEHVAKLCCLVLLQMSAVCFCGFLVPNPILCTEFLYRIPYRRPIMLSCST